MAKSREAAARSARERAKAHQRWKVAKDAAKKHASGLQRQLSRTFSRKKDPESLKILDQDNSETDDDSYPPQLQPMPPERRRGAGEPVQLTHEIDADLDSHHSFSSEIEQNNSKLKKPKGRFKHSRSQMFRFAYAQIEKEKAQQQENKNLTFSGVISMATNPEIKKRPLIEISFKDLTLTLKTKKKHILRCVTGNIKPGRITAVMGPSGAGKTSLLSALAGKTVGCKRSGSILINGKNDSIHSYKKITGFVPQDDIVHGNLTVAENLWFSANCRYPIFISYLAIVQVHCPECS